MAINVFIFQSTYEEADSEPCGDRWNGSGADIASDATKSSQCAEDDRRSLRSLDFPLPLFKPI